MSRSSSSPRQITRLTQSGKWTSSPTWGYAAAVIPRRLLVGRRHIDLMRVAGASC
ncbi:putative leader peptide [Actinoallomurus sp. NPDC052308]|uniref:putative leader peptide n=1 Tax=Actinoallomurus sp. NPDC052308 TaxID=3155530 RepID=UPI00342CCCC3